MRRKDIGVRRLALIVVHSVRQVVEAENERIIPESPNGYTRTGPTQPIDVAPGITNLFDSFHLNC
jgi:hypothetical protein